MNDADKAELRKQYAFHLGEQERLRQVTVRADRDFRAAIQIVDGMRKLYPFLAESPNQAVSPEEAPPPHNIHVLKGIEALRHVMEPQVGVYFTAVEVHKAMMALGWVDGSENAAASIRTTINRAMKAGKVNKRVKDGRTMEYTWIGSHVPERWSPERSNQAEKVVGTASVTTF